MITTQGKLMQPYTLYKLLNWFAFIFRSTIQYNSLQPFQSVMYPSAIAPLLRASSNPDLATDPIAIDARNVTEKMQRTRQFWSHGIRVAASSLVNIPSQTPQTSPPEEPSKESDEPS